MGEAGENTEGEAEEIQESRRQRQGQLAEF
jgi:hypothetical protein